MNCELRPGDLVCLNKKFFFGQVAGLTGINLPLFQGYDAAEHQQRWEHTAHVSLDSPGLLLDLFSMYPTLAKVLIDDNIIQCSAYLLKRVE